MNPGEDPTHGASLAERTVERAAALLLSAEVLPGPSPMPDFERLLTRARRRLSGARFLVGLATASALVLLTVLSFKDRRVVSYVVDGPIAISGEVIEALGSGSARGAGVVFSEGTRVELTHGSRLRVTSRSANGAAMTLERGHAGLAVTHRRGARWSIATGPFTVDVVGTRFSVDWSPERERMIVELEAGTVRVRGASVGGPLEMHPGERLEATVADHRVTLSPLVEPAATRSASSLARPGAARLARDESSAHDPVVDVEGAADRRRDTTTGELAMRDETPTTPVRHGVTHRREVALASPGSSSRREPASSSRTLLNPAAPTPSAASLPRPELQPPAIAASQSPTMTLGGGGVFCSRETAQYRFEQGVEEGISAAGVYTLALANPERDTTHSWCGEGSVRLRASFNEDGRRNYFGRFQRETGQMVMRLDRPTDFTGRTVTMHVFVEGPADARFSAEVFVVHRGHWVGSEPMRELSPGRWWTVRHTFRATNPTGGAESSNPQPYPGEGLSPVTDCNRVSLAIRSTGPRRNWNGAIYVDDVGWR